MENRFIKKIKIKDLLDKASIIYNGTDYFDKIM